MAIDKTTKTKLTDAEKKKIKQENKVSPSHVTLSLCSCPISSAFVERDLDQNTFYFPPQKALSLSNSIRYQVSTNTDNISKSINTRRRRLILARPRRRRRRTTTSVPFEKRPGLRKLSIDNLQFISIQIKCMIRERLEMVAFVVVSYWFKCDEGKFIGLERERKN